MPHSRWLAPLQLSIRAAVAAGSAVAIAHWSGVPHPLYALIAAVIATDLTATETRELGLHRLAGSVIGAIVAALLARVLPAAPWSIAIGVCLSMMLTLGARIRGTAKLAAFVCGIAMLEYTPNAWWGALNRVIEATIGIGMAVIVGFIPKLMAPAARPGDAGGAGVH